MIEVGIALWIVAIGAVAVAPLAAARLPLVYAAAIVPSGYAVYVICALALTIGGAFSSVAALASASALAVAATGGWLIICRPVVPWTRVAAEAAAVALAAAAVATAAQVVHVTRVTPDSFTYLVAAGGLERMGGLVALDASSVLKRLLVLPVLEAPGALSGLGYVASLPPLFGAAALALTWRLVDAILRMTALPRSWMIWLVIAAGALLLTTNRVVFNFAYIHTHLVFATFLLLGVGMSWLAVLVRRWELLVPAALGFAALPMLRAEAFIVAAIFLVPILTEPRLPVRGRWALAAATAATTVAWFGVAVPPHVKTADLGITGPVYSNVLGAIALLVLVAATYPERLRRPVRAAPLLVIGGLAAFVALGALRDADLFMSSVSAMAGNLVADGGWGAFWVVSVPLFILASTIVAAPTRRLLFFPIAAYPLAILAFAFLREGAYRHGTGDSGNRMMMHIVFLVVLSLISAVAASAPGETEPGLTAAPVDRR